MALFNTTKDLREFVDISLDFEFDKIRPDLVHVESSIIRPLIGSELFDEIESAFIASEVTPLTLSEEELLKAIRLMDVNLAMSFNVDVSQLKYDNQGPQRIETGDYKSPFKYQTDNLKQHYLQRGYVASESLLAFLENNTAVYTTWANSEAYTINKRFYINSARDFSQYYDIRNSRVTYLRIQATMRYCEDLLEEIISKPLADELKAEILSANVSQANQTLLDNYIKNALAPLTVAEALKDLPVDYVGDGILIYQFRSTSGTEQLRPEPHAIDSKKMVVMDRAKYYMSKLRDFLNQNASDTLYAAYYNSNLYQGNEEVEEENEDGSLYNAC